MKSNLLKSTLAAAVTTAAISVPVSAQQEGALAHFTFIHSAWMGAWQWQGLSEQLGDTVQVVAPDLAAHGSDQTNPADVTMDTYVENMVTAIDKIDGNTILVAHSFGGVVASQVVEARPNKIDAVVYMCAFMLPNEVSFLDATQGVTTSKVLNNLVFSEDGTSVNIAEHAVHEAVAHDVPADVFAQAQPNLVPEPVAPLGAKLQLTPEAYGSVPRYYIECTQDQTLPVDLQRGMYAQQSVEHVYSLASSHVPMFSDPGAVAEVLMDIAERVQLRKAQ